MSKRKEPARESTSGSVDASARERILKAAILRFSANSYEATTLRDLATDVGVDVAYVHRCFGSKEKLFSEALHATLQPARIFRANANELTHTLTKEVLRQPGADEILPLDIAFRSFSSPDASRVLHDVVMQELIAPIRERRTEVSERQAALVIAFLGGLSILRNVIRAEPVLEKEGGELEEFITRIVETVFGDEFRSRIEDHESHSGKAPRSLD